jgi:dynein heavy chain
VLTAAGLLKWVLAMVNYYNVAKGVEPKRKKVAEAEKNLRLAQKDLADTKDQLAALNAQLSSLRSQFADKTAEQQVRNNSLLQPQLHLQLAHRMRSLLYSSSVAHNSFDCA